MASIPHGISLEELVHEIMEEMQDKRAGSATLHFKGDQVRVEYRHFSERYTLAPPARARETDRPPPRALDP